ncbi:zinc finger, CCHC-type containing protein, partial [Tanacetum coccineum]
ISLYQTCPKNKRKFKNGDDKFANKKGTMTCWKCNKPGHMKKDYRSRKGKDGAGSNGSKDPEKQQGGEYYDPVYFQSLCINSSTPRLLTHHNITCGAERKNMALKKYLQTKIVNKPLMKFGPKRTYDYVSMNSIIESRDAIFDEERFTSIPRPRGIIQPSSSKIAQVEVEGIDDVPRPSVTRKSTRTRKAKSFGSDFQLYLVEGTRDKTLSQREYCFIIEEDPRTLSEAMASRDALARISTIRLLLALTAIHDLVIHQMDVKTAFLNGDLDVEIYMKQPEGFVMPRHESKIWGEAEVILGIRIKRGNNEGYFRCHLEVIIWRSLPRLRVVGIPVLDGAGMEAEWAEEFVYEISPFFFVAKTDGLTIFYQDVNMLLTLACRDKKTTIVHEIVLPSRSYGLGLISYEDRHKLEKT